MPRTRKTGRFFAKYYSFNDFLEVCCDISSTPDIVIIPSRVGLRGLVCENVKMGFILGAGDHGYCASYPLSPLSGFREDCTLVSPNLQSPERSYLPPFVMLSNAMILCSILFRSLFCT